MEKRDHSVEVADLKAVAHIEDALVLFIHSEDPNIPTSLCVQANFKSLQFDPVQPMSDSWNRILNSAFMTETGGYPTGSAFRKR